MLKEIFRSLVRVILFFILTSFLSVFLSFLVSSALLPIFFSYRFIELFPAGLLGLYAVSDSRILELRFSSAITSAVMFWASFYFFDLWGCQTLGFLMLFLVLLLLAMALSIAGDYIDQNDLLSRASRTNPIEPRTLFSLKLVLIFLLLPFFISILIMEENFISKLIVL